ncbi:hypothetical protein VP01_1483g1 [Puccinia sorghi]|uniref:Uncharacterized protein n=1 Tax=Puccinia sorghi TaxID=27349 RepID=A0A0L6VJG0_9BASI|nr:hypothetical protein VP01_1483g1 [Puccinia sorghi]
MVTYKVPSSPYSSSGSSSSSSSSPSSPSSFSPPQRRLLRRSPVASTSQNATAGSSGASPRHPPRVRAHRTSSTWVPSRLAHTILFDSERGIMDAYAAQPRRLKLNTPKSTKRGKPLMGALGRNPDQSNRPLDTVSLPSSEDFSSPHTSPPSTRASSPELAGPSSSPEPPLYLPAPPESPESPGPSDTRSPRDPAASPPPSGQSPPRASGSSTFAVRPAREVSSRRSASPEALPSQESRPASASSSRIPSWSFRASFARRSPSSASRVPASAPATPSRSGDSSLPTRGSGRGTPKRPTSSTDPGRGTRTAPTSPTRSIIEIPLVFSPSDPFPYIARRSPFVNVPPGSDGRAAASSQRSVSTGFLVGSSMLSRSTDAGSRPLRPPSGPPRPVYSFRRLNAPPPAPPIYDDVRETIITEPTGMFTERIVRRPRPAPTVSPTTGRRRADYASEAAYRWDIPMRPRLAAPPTAPLSAPPTPAASSTRAGRAASAAPALSTESSPWSFLIRPIMSVLRGAADAPAAARDPTPSDFPSPHRIASPPTTTPAGAPPPERPATPPPASTPADSSSPSRAPTPPAAIPPADASSSPRTPSPPAASPYADAHASPSAPAPSTASQPSPWGFLMRPIPPPRTVTASAFTSVSGSSSGLAGTIPFIHPSPQFSPAVVCTIADGIDSAVGGLVSC